MSCSSDDTENEAKINYPITLKFKEVGNATLEYWKGGVLTTVDAINYTNYFDEDNCLNYFDSETDPFCKSTQIVFKNDNDLTFTYNNNSFNTQYTFVNDTLKLIIENKETALGVGNKEQVTIYGSLYKFNVVLEGDQFYSGCGGDEFHKYNFDGQFFLSANDNHSFNINNPEDMGADDEIVFYNQEYILKK